ncbi:MAG: class I SAM-dependent methyltransferase [Pseudomonadota bacterium]
MSSLKLPIDLSTVRGFLETAEGELLHRVAAELRHQAPAIEIGSYCGKSTVYLGLGCQQAGRTLFAVDHHRGSEEHQEGELFHDPALADGSGAIDSFGEFRRTVAAANLEDTVVPVVTRSQVFARAWSGPLSMLFIDGGHSLEAALTDYRCWSGFLTRGSILAIHDVFPDPVAGGQAPVTVFRLALASGLFSEFAAANSLRILQRL